MTILETGGGGSQENGLSSAAITSGLAHDGLSVTVIFPKNLLLVVVVLVHVACVVLVVFLRLHLWLVN